MGRGEMNQDPVQDDYFNRVALDSYSDALVKEAIQNSLDAKADNSEGAVRVRITFPIVQGQSQSGIHSFLTAPAVTERYR